MNLIFSLPGLLQVLAFSLCVHPMHVSVTEIDFDEKDKELEITSRIFIDDLEKTLQSELKQPELDLLNPQNGQTIDQMAGKYLAGHLRISLDGKPQKTEYLGHERDGEALIFYVLVSKVKKWKTIQVFNDVITATYDDQSNLVHVTVQETVKSLRLTRNTPADKLMFDSK
jgi:hypothetical protein